MLYIKNIWKEYKTGDLRQVALDDVSLNLRDNEFVAILGQSGSGKTTLLNIIGGLDRYDAGDLIINDVSTKNYSDKDWDSYRNHSIGFVFQSYNLIAHQSVLSNVELALTISGISKKERKARATQALEKVGLGNQLHKKPNQMSGGQMQRVAIARALVNDPDILLADEPTGALDSETSIQVMELLKEVAKDRLVVMVTHNPELATQYATRIVRLKDGKITDDSNPFTDASSNDTHHHRNLGKASMSYLTSLTLSFNNLKTKKARTILTAFAGSIGIIGIALILALSSGVNRYIYDLQRDTMASYPISITAKSFDLNRIVNKQANANKEGAQPESGFNGFYADNQRLEIQESMTNSVVENDLTSFKKYLDDPNSDIHKHLGANGVVYSYSVNFDVYHKNKSGQFINTNDRDKDAPVRPNNSGFDAMIPGANKTTAVNFSQLMVGTSGNLISDIVKGSYEVVGGQWPQNANEVVLVLNEKHAVSTEALHQLGLIDDQTYEGVKKDIADGKTPEPLKFEASRVLGHEFYLLTKSDYYQKNQAGHFTLNNNPTQIPQIIQDSGQTLKVVGIISPVAGAKNANVTTAIGYTYALSQMMIDHSSQSAVIKAQESNPTHNVLNGVAFDANDDGAKVANAKRYLLGLSVSEKANMYTMMMYLASQQGSAPVMPPLSDEAQMAKALEAWVASNPDQTIMLKIYDQYVSGSTYTQNLADFGKVSYDAPASIDLYADSFEGKDAIAASIQDYNKTVDEKSRIVYTDFVALLTASITSIINVITYVLIAFVSVSLVVSSIMIGIITHISVMERTKEIGILRAIGASKRNISQVFNAETFIIGIGSGLLGILVTNILIIPINAIIHLLLKDTSVNAVLPLSYALILIVLSIVITVMAGLLPAKNAAKKDPVVALRTE